jgi:hypothetical protein
MAWWTTNEADLSFFELPSARHGVSANASETGQAPRGLR